MILIKRAISIFIIISIVIMLNGCRAVPRTEPPNPGQQRPVPKQGRVDKLAKTDESYIEENINGFGIEEDLRITEITDREGENRVAGLNQEEKMRLLENIEPKKLNTVLEEYASTLPDAITAALQYHKYNISYDYLLITNEEGATIRENPSPNAEVTAEIEYLDKISLLQRVEGESFGGSNIWFRVACGIRGEVNEGYVHSNSAKPRVFRFERMVEVARDLQELLRQGELHFVSNYKNQNGTPPQRGAAAVDEFGYRVYHSAPAYKQADTNSSYRYVPDGMLVRKIGESGDFYHINIPTFGGNFYIPKQFIEQNRTLSSLNHVIVIDRTQQNQGAFEVVGNNLNMVSYSLSTTGLPGEFSFETTLGIFKAIEKRERFEYLKSGTKDIAGYAPFAIRFTGGAYIHGVPVAYEEENGERVDPGLIEYLHTIGTFPRSNMCVRNFTSHAQFLYNWMDIQNGAVIVME
jgi:hypothetical protein